MGLTKVYIEILICSELAHAYDCYTHTHTHTQWWACWQAQFSFQMLLVLYDKVTNFLH